MHGSIPVRLIKKMQSHEYRVQNNELKYYYSWNFDILDSAFDILQ